MLQEAMIDRRSSARSPENFKESRYSDSFLVETLLQEWIFTLIVTVARDSVSEMANFRGNTLIQSICASWRIQDLFSNPVRRLNICDCFHSKTDSINGPALSPSCGQRIELCKKSEHTLAVRRRFPSNSIWRNNAIQHS